MSSFCSSVRQYLATIRCQHSLSESMYSFPRFLFRLECHFHFSCTSFNIPSNKTINVTHKAHRSNYSSKFSIRQVFILIFFMRSENEIFQGKRNTLLQSLLLFYSFPYMPASLTQIIVKDSSHFFKHTLSTLLLTCGYFSITSLFIVFSILYYYNRKKLIHATYCI